MLSLRLRTPTDPVIYTTVQTATSQSSRAATAGPMNLPDASGDAATDDDVLSELTSAKTGTVSSVADSSVTPLSSPKISDSVAVPHHEQVGPATVGSGSRTRLLTGLDAGSIMRIRSVRASVTSLSSNNNNQ